MSGNQLLIQKDDGTVTGRGSPEARAATRCASGREATRRRRHPFRVIEDGKMVATDAEVHGSGSFEVT